MRSKQLGYLGIGPRRVLNVVQRPFSPLDLFATGEQGVWYDPSDLSTMFQDSAGTTPVTAVEQPVGLLLDKSKGLVLGPELVTNGDFSDGTTGWTVGSNWAISGGVAAALAAVYNVNNLDTSVTVTSGATYKVTFTVSGYSAGSLRLDLVGVQSIFTGGVTANGSYTYYFVAALGGARTFRLTGSTGGGFTGSIDNISVREIAGNHASQSTSASRPTLSARYNLLTYSEQFDNAAWGMDAMLAFGSGSTANAAVAPNGTTTADLIVPNTSNSNTHRIRQANGTSSVAHIMSVYVKAAGYSKVGIREGNVTGAYATFDLSGAGVVIESGSGGTGGITAIGDGWYRITVEFTAGASVRLDLHVMDAGYTSGAPTMYFYAGDGTSGIYVWGAQLIVTNDLTSNAYQRIAAATDYDSDATKFPKYLRFDGSDDSLATSSIDFSGTNKLSIFSALRRLSDSAQGMVLELSATTASNNGTFSLETPSTASGSDFQFISKGTVANTINADDYPNPYSAIITAQSAISTPLSNIRINGLEVDSDAGTQGTGNFGNFPLYVGRRNNASLPFNGRLYGMIVRGAETPEYLVEITESWLFGKSGITLDTTPDYTFVTLSNGDFVVDAYGNNVFIEVS